MLLSLHTSAFESDTSTHAHIQPFAFNTINLRDHPWGQNEHFELAGYWDFAWQAFVKKPMQQGQTKWTRMHVPGSWDQRYFKGPESIPPLPPKGYGTYFTRLLVPKDLDEIYLYLPDMASAYELWSGGKLLGGNGQIADTKQKETPAYLPRVYTLYPENGIVDVFILTSNYHYQWGGLWYAPKVTDATGLFRLKDWPMIQAVIVSTILLMSAVFCILLFWSRPQETKILYFSLFCFAIGIRRLCIDERAIYLADLFDWSTLQATENITMYLMLPFFLAYVRGVFPQTTPSRLPLLGTVIAVPFCMAVLFTEVETYSRFNLPFQLMLAVFFPIVLISWVKAFVARHRGARMFGVSLAVFLLAIINDILNYNYVIETANLTHLGALAFVLFQLAALIQRYLSNFREIENLSASLSARNAELLKLDQFKDDFLASTSHELRMPLHGIAGLANHVNRQSEAKLTEEDHNKLKLIESTAKRLGHLVNDILDVASMKHGKLSLQLEPTRLGPLIESTLISLDTLIKDKNVTLDFSVDEDADCVMADAQRVQQILFNLIGNAIKFTDQGSIHLEAIPHGDEITIRVSDTGKGIEEDKLKDILKPFETADTHSHEIRGSGLGLPITKMLVEMHHGKFSIRSKTNVGTTAEFTLPKSEEQPRISDQREADPTLSPADQDLGEVKAQSHVSNRESSANELTAGAQIYFADDEAVNRELIQAQLVESGYQVTVFNDGQSLLNALNSDIPDLILLDWMMPGKNGLTVCQEIREHYDGNELPIIMLTARLQVTDIVQALDAGASDYITKPYHESELRARVASQISTKRLWLSSLENAKLKIEVQKTEQERNTLSTTNHRLTHALNASPQGLIIFDDDLDIQFINAHASDLISGSRTTLKETSLFELLDDDSCVQLQRSLDNKISEESLPIHLKQASCQFKAVIKRSDNDNDPYHMLIISEDTTEDAPNTQALLSSLTQELAENRRRMGMIESTLLQLNQESGDAISQTDVEMNPKELVVKTLRTTLITWERYTGKTKADLAEQSRCWRVYIDGTTAKTRTLDKYLSVKTLPAKPRWRAVIKTANYVLDNCELSEADENELTELIDSLNTAFS